MNNKLVLLLISVSAIIHPLWNMLLKKSQDKVIFYFNIHLFFTILFSLILFIYPLSSVSLSGWILVLFSSIAHFFYQLYLCRSYELGDLSLTYPIVRSAPLFVVILGFVFLGEKLSAISIVGIILTVIGAQLINQKNITFSKLLNFWRDADKKTVIATTLTAFFSALYSVIDKRGVLQVHPVLYFYLFFAFSGFFFGIYLLFFKDKVKNYGVLTKRNGFKIALASVLEFSSYVLILYAFKLANVATVIAIRQISVVFGALMGIFFLKEHYGKARILASFIIFAGIYLLIAFK